MTGLLGALFLKGHARQDIALTGEGSALRTYRWVKHEPLEAVGDDYDDAHAPSRIPRSFSSSFAHSYFNALTGRTLDAFIAGYIPAMSPVATPMAAAIGNQVRL
jgi:hypothetical protein